MTTSEKSQKLVKQIYTGIENHNFTESEEILGYVVGVLSDRIIRLEERIEKCENHSHGIPGIAQ